MSKDWEEKFRPEDLQRIRGFRLMDDDFMSKCFEENIECTELVLQIVLGRDDLKVEKVAIQHQLKNLQGRSIIFDIYATDHAGKRYNVEIQQESEGASPKRARYHSGLLDMNTLNPGQDYEELPESYVIFITRDDVPGKGLPIYHADRVIEETGDMFGDGAHIIYVNSSIQNEDTDLGRLMHDLHCKNADEMYSEILSKRVSELKETEGETGSMCEALEELMKEMRQECEIKRTQKNGKSSFSEGNVNKRNRRSHQRKRSHRRELVGAAGR